MSDDYRERRDRNWNDQDRWREDDRRESYGYRGRDRDYGRDRRSAEGWRDYGRRAESGRRYEEDPERYGRDYGRRDYNPPAGLPGTAWGFDEWGRDPGWDYGWSSGYGRDYSSRNARRDWYDQDRDAYRGYGERRQPHGERGFWDRASDEVSSWFGDEDATRRRREDDRAYHRGRGPRGYTRSDERIREDVSDRLTDNPILDAGDIDVAVQNGEVTLDGRVDSRYSKRLAEDITEDVSGVRHVQNNLRVRASHESISGTSSGIAENGRTSDLGRTSGSGVTGSTGTGNTTGTTRR